MVSLGCWLWKMDRGWWINHSSSWHALWWHCWGPHFYKFSDPERKPDQWFSKCTIISCKNDDTGHLNSDILGMFPREQKIMQSTDSLVTESPDEIQNAMTVEFLNSITVSGFPLSHLALKVGSLMLLCNLDPSNGLCNGTHLILTRFKPYVLECRIISGVGCGNTVLVPRI